MAEPSSERLATALEEADLHDMAERARADEFHDFKSPHELPAHQLVHELTARCTPAAKALADRVMAGDFDATTAESQAWANSEQGRDAISAIAENLRKET